MMYWDTWPTSGTPEAKRLAIPDPPRAYRRQSAREGEGRTWAGVVAVKITIASSAADYRKRAVVPGSIGGGAVLVRIRGSAIIIGSHGNSFMEVSSKYASTRARRGQYVRGHKTGGKQYRVASGEKIKVEQIAADVGQEIVIDQVLAVGNGAELKVGTPLVSGATVKATVVAHGKTTKCIFKMRRRKHYQNAKVTASSSPNCKSATLLLKEGAESWHRKRRRLYAKRARFQAQDAGVKAFGGELISAGSIIVRQRGTKFHPGSNVGVGKDHTLFALVDGHVSFAIKGAMSKHTVNVTAAA